MTMPLADHIPNSAVIRTELEHLVLRSSIEVYPNLTSTPTRTIFSVS